jgi:hypothetical protein
MSTIQVMVLIGAEVFISRMAAGGGVSARAVRAVVGLAGLTAEDGDAIGRADVEVGHEAGALTGLAVQGRAVVGVEGRRGRIILVVDGAGPAGAEGQKGARGQASLAVHVGLDEDGGLAPAQDLGRDAQWPRSRADKGELGRAQGRGAALAILARRPLAGRHAEGGADATEQGAALGPVVGDGQ